MEQVKSFIAELFTKVNGLLEPILQPVITFFSGGQYTLYAVLAIWGLILAIVGLISFVMKGTKFFIILAILTAIVFGAWFFIR